MQIDLSESDVDLVLGGLSLLGRYDLAPLARSAAAKGLRKRLAALVPQPVPCAGCTRSGLHGVFTIVTLQQSYAVPLCPECLRIYTSIQGAVQAQMARKGDTS